jgi:hypothetical protein
MKMRKTISVVLMVLTLSMSLVGAASAQADLPVGGCPDGFELMEVMEHDQMEHNHLGLHVDLNGDGYLCMKHVTAQNHVHIDNFAVVR